MSYGSEMQDIFDSFGFGDWLAQDGSVIICPEGEALEPDGECPCHGPSPLIVLGVI